MGYLLHLMFRCDGDVMESDVFVGVFDGSKRGHCMFSGRFDLQITVLEFLNATSRIARAHA